MSTTKQETRPFSELLDEITLATANGKVSDHSFAMQAALDAYGSTQQELREWREIAKSALASLDALYAQQQEISSPDTRWELPIYSRAREIRDRLRSLLKD